MAIRKRLDVKANLYTILQILSVTLLEKVPVLQALSQAEAQTLEVEHHNQPFLFDL